MQAYSDPKRESDLHALPDIEVWESVVWELDCTCGVYSVPSSSCLQDKWADCPSCGESERPILKTSRMAWWWWSCFPGCLPDGDPIGPFATQAEALADAQGDNATDTEAPELWVITFGDGRYLHQSVIGSFGPQASWCSAWGTREHAQRAFDAMPESAKLGASVVKLSDAEACAWGNSDTDTD